MRWGWYAGMFRSSRRRGNASWILLLAGAGIVLVAVGYIGRFFARWIKAAVSREREFLADASAVQFTRNRDGLAGALKKIGGFAHGSQISADRAEEASHLFFGDAAVHRLSSIFATHPPLRERIARLDPNFDGDFREVVSEESVEDPGVFVGLSSSVVRDESLIQKHMRASSQGFGERGGDRAAALVGSSPAQVLSQIGQVEAVSSDTARAMLDTIPQSLHSAAGSAFSAEALIFALLLRPRHSSAELYKQQLAAIVKHAGTQSANEAMHLLKAVETMDLRLRLPLVELCAPALRDLTESQRSVFADTVHHLIQADQEVSVFEYVLAHTLRRRMWQVDRGGRRALKRASSLASIREELRLVLSLLSHAGHDDPQEAQQAYQRARSRLSKADLLEAHPIANSPHLLGGLGVALDQLEATKGTLSRQIVDACTHAVLADNHVTVEEGELLRVICDSLGVPMPPFLATTQHSMA